MLCESYSPGHTSTFTSFGRKPLVVDDVPTAPRSAAEHYARVAYAETVAILSFQQLALDLEALGASVRLIRAARNAARDEARHAHAALALAKRFGGADRSLWPALHRPQRRTPRLFDVALENATGGCVNETFGTWLQLHQADHAPDAELRAVARHTARDEASHAALAFELFDFFSEKLTPEERLKIRAAMRRDIERLEGSLRLSPELARELGLPQSSEMRHAARLIERALPIAFG